jgi:hypothetical protein
MSIGHITHSLKEFFKPDHSPASKFKSFRAAKVGLRDGFKGNMLNIPFIAFEAGSAQRGEQLATVTGRVGGMLTYPALSAAFAMGVAMIPGVNVGAAALAASLLAMYANSLLEDSAIRKIKWLNDKGKSIRHLELGGRYQDTNYAQKMRQTAMAELSSAQAPSRRYLGNEAIFAHR